MKKIFILTLLAFLSSCHYSDLKGTMGQSVDNSVKMNKIGVACVRNILSLFSFGDSSIESARKNGEITKIVFVDTSYTDFFFYIPIVQKGCTIVRGE
jgi:hypothetical protein